MDNQEKIKVNVAVEMLLSYLGDLSAKREVNDEKLDGLLDDLELAQENFNAEEDDADD